MLQKKPIVICGPSGSGKSTLLKRLMAENKDDFVFTVSHTTREPRKGEQNGKEYHFLDRNQMLKLIDSGEFIEHTEFSGNIYGTSKMAIKDALKTGKTLILEVDIEGVKALKAKCEQTLEPLFIFIKPPSKEHLIQRLSSRNTEDLEHRKRRLDRADEEIRVAESGSLKFDLTLVNDDIDSTYKQLKQFLYANHN